ncbi:hypothetical protein Pmgp_02135 [Pelotomaculum propionicicum]|uniref:Uncharacterized protein n=2 Tax=Pelotomaculum propionicicum TaxID=258475 RepID=A0A4Y7RNW4_9FIRM|nr:hypothetical protein Pmgp_02135 [Pelotomaculum propionicicum]
MQTYVRLEEELYMERVWKEENTMINFKTDYDVIEILLGWLEKDDTEIEKLFGYGLCLAAVTYFVSRLFQSFL